MNAVSQTSEDRAFEFKSAQFSLPRLLLKNTQMQSIAEQMESHVNSAPSFFSNTPVVIDLAEIGDNAEVDFPWLVGLLRGYGMIPFGVRGAGTGQKEMAELMELAILADHSSEENATRKPTPNPSAARRRADVATLAVQKSRLITTPVRSGQRVYAPNGDLIITAQVSSGAEVIADGNIHIYGTLRGRALAGVKGNRDARIFCHNLQAELVAVAGQYRVNDTLTDEQKNCPVQIHLDENRLMINPL
ncbi:MAG: septum site-determining protein MinC [Gammaproteobacteria bacterium]|jgi:septum site-determining protein MinC